MLEADRTHPTAEQLHEQLRDLQPSLSLSTVYKTLEAFLKAGLVRRVVGDRSLRVDGVAKEHDHAVCRACGQVFDIERKHMALPAAPARLPHGLTVHGLRLEYDDVCSGCKPDA